MKQTRADRWLHRQIEENLPQPWTAADYDAARESLMRTMIYERLLLADRVEELRDRTVVPVAEFLLRQVNRW